jgi:hypothetical protein
MALEETLTYVVAVAVPVWLVVEQMMVRRRSARARQRHAAAVDGRDELPVTREQAALRRTSPLPELPQKAA